MSGWGVFDVKAVNDPLKHATNEVMMFHVYAMNWAGEMRKPTVDKFALFMGQFCCQFLST